MGPRTVFDTGVSHPLRLTHFYDNLNPGINNLRLSCWAESKRGNRYCPYPS